MRYYVCPNVAAEQQPLSKRATVIFAGIMMAPVVLTTLIFWLIFGEEMFFTWWVEWIGLFASLVLSSLTWFTIEKVAGRPLV
jgi:hypothetical protein